MQHSTMTDSPPRDNFAVQPCDSIEFDLCPKNSSPEVLFTHNGGYGDASTTVYHTPDTFLAMKPGSNKPFDPNRILLTLVSGSWLGAAHAKPTLFAQFAQTVPPGAMEVVIDPNTKKRVCKINHFTQCFTLNTFISGDGHLCFRLESLFHGLKKKRTKLQGMHTRRDNVKFTVKFEDKITGGVCFYTFHSHKTNKMPPQLRKRTREEALVNDFKCKIQKCSATQLDMWQQIIDKSHAIISAAQLD